MHENCERSWWWRKPRVKWVQQQSLALFAQIRQTTARRNAFLRENGEKTLCDCFRPLIRGAMTV
jgi:hypothetical protein